MCGDTHRPACGGTIAMVSPIENKISSNTSESSFSSSPDSVTSSASTMSSYSLFFRDAETDSHKTKAIFRIDDAETYNTLRACHQVNMRIEQYGDLSTTKPTTRPLHEFRLDLGKQAPREFQRDVELELPIRLDLGVSEKGVVGRQVTMSEPDGTVLGVGIVGYN
ncbi:hypothetical protein N7478_001281 [Penicillium angulare]|uniref:uncharacterized protein n=1 Tax=Penicillium angulare TaxID=116970 RepID=UPI00253FB93F|nr:uncharacterized protein N7478_001281 [Penicillium angulare]KAJ5292030.1 hypothetical protein N7478_001281 [Penicillium angulare]